MTDLIEDADRKELLKSAYRKIKELRARLDEVELRHDEPVAIVGMGCRFPGGVEDPEAFWRLLSQGLDGTTEIPPDRWNVDDYYDADPEASNKMYVRRGGFINRVRGFDPLFFHVSPLEAASMDPQQRVLLEVAWEALKNAAIAPDGLAGSRTGVFVGIGGTDFIAIALQALHQGGARSHTAMGISHSIAAGHISYFLGLRGPCMAIDTACSSGLTAIHVAIESLRKGESTAALAGSVNLILLPEGHVICCNARMLSPDGHCKTFDASADGYSRGEGCAVLVLKLLSRAQADGDRILAVIRGSACNQDGRTNGITAPSGNAQREVIQAALAAARVSPNDIDYVETHGTGTSLGDPIEAQALGEVFAPGRPAGRELVLGAVKSNIGHLEAAAGMAAIGKVILALQKGAIPPNLHFHAPSPHIPWDALPFSVPTRLTPWNAGGSRRLAGVSAFGFSGTNVHMVLEEAPEPAPVAVVPDRGHHLLTLSAQTPKALSELAARYVGFLDEEPGTNLGDLCFTASAGRNHFAQRLGIVADTTGELRAALRRFVDAPGSEPRIAAGRAPTRPPQLGMLIGKLAPTDLHRSMHALSPAFRDAFDVCDTAARDLLFLPSLSDSLARPSAIEESPRQRALAFALAYATARLWLDWGMTPVALAASGTEACVAAVIAGAIGLPDALRLAADPRVVETTPIEWSTPAIPVLSATTGEPLSAGLLRRFAGDDRNGSSGPARDGETPGRLRPEGVNLMLSIGGNEGDAAVESDVKIVRANCNDWTDVLEATAELYVAGAPPDWRRFEAPWPRRRLALPTYPFQRQDCWPNVALPSPVKPSQRAPHFPVLGRRIYAARFKDDIVFEAELSAESPALLKDHSFYSTPVVAMTTMLDMAISAGRTRLGDAVMLQGVTIERPMVLSAGQTQIVQTILTPRADGGFAFSIVAADLEEAGGASSWRRHCSGEIVRRLEAEGAARRAVSLSDIAARCKESVDPNWFYDKVARSGVDYGPSFRAMREVKRSHERVFAKLALPPELAGNAADFAVHPGLLDGAIQALGLCYSIDEASSEAQDVYMPVGVERFAMSRFGVSEVWCHANLHPRDADQLDTLNGDITLFTRTGEWIGEVTGIQFRRNAKRQVIQADENRLASWLYQPRWEALPTLNAGAVLTGTWLVVAAERAVAAAFSQRIRDRGGRVIFVEEGEAFARLDAGGYVMRLDTAADYDELLRAVGVTERLDGVVYFAGGTSEHDEDAASVPARAKQDTTNVLHLVQALLRNGLDELRSLALIVRGFEAPSLASPANVAAGAVWGFGRVVAAELPELNCKLYDLEPTLTPIEAAGLLALELASASTENQVALSKSGRSGLRLNRAATSDPAGSISAAHKAAWPVQLEIGERGDFRQLDFAPQQIEAPRPGDVQIRLHATAVNFRDVLNVLGMYPGDPGALGVECAGEIVAIGAGVEGFAPGDRVLAIPRRGYCSYANAPAAMVFHRPPNLSLPEAATLLVAYLTASYALNHIGRMAAGNRVLIHAAAGGVGLAAVQLAQRAGAEIFATAGSPAKREYLRQIGVHHVMDSRSLDFADEIKALAGERGLDLVLNSVTGPAMAASLALVRAGGWFLEIGKTDIYTPEQANAINADAHHVVVDLLAPFEDTPDLMRDLFADITRGLSGGDLRPLPYRGFPLRDTPQALRFMASAKHIGKVVVIDDVAADSAVDPSGCYLITGGLGGLGLACALGLASKGARRIILVGRRPPTEEARAKIEEIERSGATVVVCTADVGDRAQLEGVLAANLSPAAPLRGVIHAAGVIDDGAIVFQDQARCSRVMTPKIDGAWHLHELTLNMPLEFFVLFSSGAGLFGNPGQSSYAAASVFLDNLAAARRASGLPALSIDWGPWAEVGMAARMARQGVRNWESRGLQSMTPDEGIAILRMLLETDRGPQIAVLPIDPSAWRQTAPGRTISPLLTNLAATPVQTSVVKNADRMALRLRQAEPEARLGILVEIVTEVVSDIFGLDRSVPLAADQNLTELGMDSLLAVQLSNRLRSMFSVAVPISLALQRPTVEAISEHMLEKITSAAEPDRAVAPAVDNGAPALEGAEIAWNPASAGDLLANLDQLSDSDIENLLETIDVEVQAG